MDMITDDVTIQIHLMFQFIEVAKLSGMEESVFKYISCSNLSEVAKLSGMEESVFKYISCSNLSDVDTAEQELATTFTYISWANGSLVLIDM